MNDLSFNLSIVIKILNIYVFFKKRFKRILKNKRSLGVWENLELRLQFQGNVVPGSSSRSLILTVHYKMYITLKISRKEGKLHDFFYLLNKIPCKSITDERLTKGHYIFPTKTIKANFLHLMVLICKIFVNHFFKCHFVLHFVAQ